MEFGYSARAKFESGKATEKMRQVKCKHDGEAAAFLFYFTREVLDEELTHSQYGTCLRLDVVEVAGAAGKGCRRRRRRRTRSCGRRGRPRFISNAPKAQCLPVGRSKIFGLGSPKPSDVFFFS